MQINLGLQAIDVCGDIAVVRPPIPPEEWLRDWKPHVLQAQKLPDGKHFALRLKPGTLVTATEPSHGSQSLSNQVDPWKWIDL